MQKLNETNKGLERELEIIEKNKEIYLNYNYVTEFSYDSKKSYFTGTREDFSWCYQIRDYELLEYFTDIFDLRGYNLSDFDFEHNYYLIMLGRKLDGLFYRKVSPEGFEGYYIFTPIFDVNKYEKNTVYMYSTEKIQMMSPGVHDFCFIEFNYKKEDIFSKYHIK